MRQLACHALFTFPIALAYKPITGRVSAEYGLQITLPMLALRHHAAPWATTPIDTTLPPVIDGANTYYHQDPHRQELTDARVVVVPLIDQPGKGGRTDVTILAFATFFVDSAGGGQVNGRFVGILVPKSVSGGGIGASFTL